MLVMANRELTEDRNLSKIVKPAAEVSVIIVKELQTTILNILCHCNTSKIRIQ